VTSIPRYIFIVLPPPLLPRNIPPVCRLTIRYNTIKCLFLPEPSNLRREINNTIWVLCIRIPFSAFNSTVRPAAHVRHLTCGAAACPVRTETYTRITYRRRYVFDSEQWKPIAKKRAIFAYFVYQKYVSAKIKKRRYWVHPCIDDGLTRGGFMTFYFRIYAKILISFSTTAEWVFNRLTNLREIIQIIFLPFILFVKSFTIRPTSSFGHDNFP